MLEYIRNNQQCAAIFLKARSYRQGWWFFKGLFGQMVARRSDGVPSDIILMTYAIMAYNNTIHSMTGYTPFEVVFGHTDSFSTLDIDFSKQFMQQLLRDHTKITKELYKYINCKMVRKK